MTTALVTGAAGFLGSHVTERLIAEGRRVIGLDNLMTGRRRNIAHLINHPMFRFVEGDVRRFKLDETVSEIWNLASPASPPRYQRDPVDTLMINVVGTQAMLAAAREQGARFFQASTSEVYGDAQVHPQREDYCGNVNPTGPRACYDEGKRAAEALCFDYRRMYGLDVRVARIFNTYGPRMDPADGRVVSNFIVRALQGLPLELYGGGKQTRSFCHVDDLVDGFFAMMRADSPPEGPVNLGNPDEFTIRALADAVAAVTGRPVRVIDLPLPQDDPLQRRPDIALAKALYGWAPRISLAEGLASSLPFFIAELAEAQATESAVP